MATDGVQRLKDESDNYEQTVIAIISFAHLLRYDDSPKNYLPDSVFFIGRKMDTSPNNRINPNSFATPDLILQISPKYGIVGEVKKSLPQNKEFWKKYFRQLQKYDDDLKGWKTPNEKIQKMDLVFLTDYLLKSEVLEYIKLKIQTGEFKTNNNFCVVTFMRLHESEEKFTFENISGKFSDMYANEILKIGTPRAMPLEDVMNYNKNFTVKFYDSPPPLPYMMMVLWDNIFPSIKTIEQYIDEKGKKRQKFEVNIDFLTNELREKFSHNANHDSRQKKIPEKDWVKKAMDEFVRLGYAETKIDDKNSYIVKKRLIKEPLERFCKDVEKGRSLKLGTIQKTLEKWTEN